MEKHKKIISFISCTVLLLVLSGCGSSNEPVDIDYNIDPDTTYTINAAAWSGETFMPQRMELAEEKLAEQGINVDIEYQDYPTDYQTSMNSQLTGGTAPCLVYSAEYVNEWSQRGQIIALDELIEHEGLDLEENFGSLANMYQYDGVTYGLPDRGAPMMMFYNKDLYDAVGLDYPDDTWTYEDYYEAGQKINDYTEDVNTSTYGFMVNPGWWPFWMAPFYGTGGDIIDDDGNAVVNSEENIETLQNIIDLAYEDHLSPTADEMADYTAGGDGLFADGRVGAMPGGWWVSGMLNETDVNYGVAPMPNKTTIGFGAGWNITSTCEQPYVAFKVMEELTTDTESEDIILTTNNDMPANSGSLNTTFMNMEYPDNAQFDKQYVIDSYNYLAQVDYTPYFTEMTTVIGDAITAAFNGEMSAEDALQQAEDNLTETIERYNEESAQIAENASESAKTDENETGSE